MGQVFIYPPNCTDFANNGLGALMPTETTVHEVKLGLWELTMVHPVDEHGRWAQIQNQVWLKASVPVRESPDSDMYTDPGVTVVRREIYRVQTTTGQRLLMRSKPDLSAPVVGSIANGREGMLVEKTNGTWWKMMDTNGGASGYMYAQYLVFDRAYNEQVKQPGQGVSRKVITPEASRMQLFRVYQTELDTERMQVTAKAYHATYDLRANPVIQPCEFDAEDAKTALLKCWNALANPHPFTLHCERLTGTVTGTFTYKNMIEVLLDPDEGFAAQTGCRVIRDNFDIYVLPDYERDNGVTIRRGKNLIGVTVTADASDVVTRIIPVGQYKDGSDLICDPVDSPNIDAYPVPYTQAITYFIRVGDDGYETEAQARAALQAEAENSFAAGADQPTYGMDVDYVTLEHIYGATPYAKLQTVHMYDTVTVIDELVGLKARVRMSEYEWDALNDRYLSTHVGDVETNLQSVYSYNLPTGGVSGNKITPNTAPGNILRNLSVDYAKISNAAVQQLNANTISAVEANIQKIAAGEIKADELIAAVADIVALHVKDLDAASITADRLAAALAQFSVITAGSAEFDRETVRHLISQALQVEDAVGENVFIKNLAIDYAQIVRANVGNLCVRADDGNYYRLVVDENGNVSAQLTYVSPEELGRGETAAGAPIIETQLTVSDLSATSIKGVYALINRIDAARIDVDTLTARQAFIDYLHTADLSANTSLRISLESTNKVWRGETEPTEAKDGDLWVVPSTGYIYQQLPGNADLTGYSFEVTNGLVLIHGTNDTTYTMTANSGSLVVDYNADCKVRFEVTESGDISVKAYTWTRVKDGELTLAQQQAVKAIQDAQNANTAASTAQKSADTAHDTALNAAEVAQSAQDSVDIMNRYMTFSDDGLKQFLPGSIYYTRIDEKGFNVHSERAAEPIATMNAEEGVKAQAFTLGDIICKATSKGGWAWQEASE